MKVYEGWASRGIGQADWLYDTPSDLFNSVARFDNVTIEVASKIGAVRVRIEILEEYSGSPYSDKDLAVYMEAR